MTRKLLIAAFALLVLIVGVWVIVGTSTTSSGLT